MTFTFSDGRTFEAWADMIDVTSLHRPDLSWKFIDPSGHHHRWSSPTELAVAPDSYRGDITYSVKSVEWVRDPSIFTEEGEEIFQGHFECIACRFHIEPGYTADNTTQYMTGMRHYRIDGRSVSPEEFKKELDKSRFNR